MTGDDILSTCMWQLNYLIIFYNTIDQVVVALTHKVDHMSAQMIICALSERYGGSGEIWNIQLF